MWTYPAEHSDTVTRCCYRSSLVNKETPIVVSRLACTKLFLSLSHSVVYQHHNDNLCHFIIVFSLFSAFFSMIDSCATRATFTCNAGYQLQGSATSYCLVGEWSSAAATCVVEPTTQAPVEVPTVPGGCLPFEPVANGALSTFSLGNDQDVNEINSRFWKSFKDMHAANAILFYWLFHWCGCMGVWEGGICCNS